MTFVLPSFLDGEMLFYLMSSWSALLFLFVAYLTVAWHNNTVGDQILYEGDAYKKLKRHNYIFVMLETVWMLGFAASLIAMMTHEST